MGDKIAMVAQFQENWCSGQWIGLKEGKCTLLRMLDLICDKSRDEKQKWMTNVHTWYEYKYIQINI